MRAPVPTRAAGGIAILIIITLRQASTTSKSFKGRCGVSGTRSYYIHSIWDVKPHCGPLQPLHNPHTTLIAWGLGRLIPGKVACLLVASETSRSPTALLRRIPHPVIVVYREYLWALVEVPLSAVGYARF